MSRRNLDFGKTGEELAVNFLKTKGYKVIERNYKAKIGEIDIIALDKDTYCFIEVKTRYSNKFGLPEESILQSKQNQISKTALHFLKENSLLDKKARFDVVSVLCTSLDEPEVNLIKDAFELSDAFTL